MFKLRLTIDFHPRTKKGQPPQSTTGVARNISIQAQARGDAQLSSGRPGKKSLMAMMRTGTVRAVPTQNRRRMSLSSGFSPASAVIVLGSRAIPQIGHAPGAARTICGCMGHVYSTLEPASGVTRSRPMPHFGQESCSCERTSGCIGQVYPPSLPADGLAEGGDEVLGVMKV